MNDYDTELANLQYDGINPEDVETAKNNRLEPPIFPVIIFCLAVVKDITDMVSLGTIGIIVNIIVAPVFFFYLWGKVGFIKKKLWRWLISTIVLEFIPGISFVPMSTIFVLRAHATERKKIEKVLNFIESFAKVQ
ncbi:MAG: hypothetical protein HYT38_01295 [Candidatus Sungbacteria bacterium]|uniref:Uncharacterized protein n=1 Tax=Candidatus Sungiibacteriota bacterium TaxID=2750080 RepID=A0A9D6DQ99_9BACT|nr:hypothetical protein [Candidatus Sungbacteria bacterium]